MENTTTLYRKALLQTFASEDCNDGQCEAFIRDFDKLVKTGMSGESATAIVYSAWGSSAPDKVCRTISDWIENQIHKQVSGKTISTQNRLADLIKRINNNISALSGVTVGGKSLDESELEQIKIHMPYASRQTFSATASDNHPNSKARAKTLSLEIVSYF